MHVPNVVNQFKLVLDSTAICYLDIIVLQTIIYTYCTAFHFQVVTGRVSFQVHLVVLPPYPVAVRILPKFEEPSSRSSRDHVCLDVIPCPVPDLPNSPLGVIGVKDGLPPGVPPNQPPVGLSQFQDESLEGTTLGCSLRLGFHSDAANPPRPRPVQNPGRQFNVLLPAEGLRLSGSEYGGGGSR